MTIDERLQALTESLELLVHGHMDLERFHREHEQTLQKNQVLLTGVIESIDSLSRIAHLHERRISDLEDNQS